jgi:cephalosporin hydroxylase
MAVLTDLSRIANRLKLRLRHELDLRHAARQLKPLLAVSTADQIVQGAFAFRGRGVYRKIRPDQDPAEFTELLQRVQARRPRVIVDIGTRHGGTLFGWIRSNPQAELVISIALPESYPPARGRLFQRFVSDRPQTQLVCLRADSHDPTTITAVRNTLTGRRIDLLFLDGDQQFDGLTRDYESYFPLMRHDGLIVVHDIRAVQPTNQVGRFWQTVRAQHHSEEIAHHPRNHGYGLLMLDH